VSCSRCKSDWGVEDQRQTQVSVKGDGGKVVAPFHMVGAAGGGPAVSDVFKSSVR
jgi:hypothetical protein